MKYLLYYNLDSKFVTDQTNAGGDGSKVVSVVDGVAWTKDQEKTYYRYSLKEEDIVSYTLTVNYYNDFNGEVAASSDNITIQSYSGCLTNYFATPKNISGMTPIEGGKAVTLSGNSSCDFYYIPDEITANAIRVVYEKKYSGGNAIYGTSEFVNDLKYAIIDGEKVSPENVTGIYNLTGDIKTRHEIIYVFNNDLERIVASAFSNCSGVQEVELPNSITGVGGFAFYGNSELKNIELPNGLVSLGEDCFGYAGIEYINFPSGITYIPKRAFRNTKLKKLDLPPTIESIGAESFNNCKELQSVFIPNSVTGLGVSCFNSCEKMTDLVFEGNTTNITEIKDSFVWCYSLKRLVLPNGLKSIGACAFEYASGLTELVLPESLCHVDWLAFDGCPKLSSITSYALEAPVLCNFSMDDNPFRYIMRNGTLLCPAGSDYSTWLENRYLGMYGWSAQSIDDYYREKPFTIRMLEGGTFKWSGRERYIANQKLTYQINNGKKVTMTASSEGTIVEVNSGDEVKFFGTNSQYGYMDGRPVGTFRANPLKIDGKCIVEGNIMSIIDESAYTRDENFNTDYSNINQDTFRFFLANSTGITSAKNLRLPPINDKTNLVFKMGMLDSMFYGCENLVEAPMIPYAEIPMYGAPSMFYHCSKLNHITCLATDIYDLTSMGAGTGGWVAGVAERGEFVKNRDMNDWPINSSNGIPSGWTVKDYGQEPLPANIIQKNYIETTWDKVDVEGPWCGITTDLASPSGAVVLTSFYVPDADSDWAAISESNNFVIHVYYSTDSGSQYLHCGRTNDGVQRIYEHDSLHINGSFYALVGLSGSSNQGYGTWFKSQSSPFVYNKYDKNDYNPLTRCYYNWTRAESFQKPGIAFFGQKVLPGTRLYGQVVYSPNFAGLVYDFIPAFNTDTNKYGLFEKVTGRFFSDPNGRLTGN